MNAEKPNKSLASSAENANKEAGCAKRGVLTKSKALASSAENANKEVGCAKRSVPNKSKALTSSAENAGSNCHRQLSPF